MRKGLICFTLVLVLLLAVAGVAGASPSCEEVVDFPVYIDVPVAPAAPPPQLRPSVDSSWMPFNGLDRSFVSLAPGQNIIVNLNVPKELGSYTVSWISQDTSIATVVANSPARITARGVGETWILAVVKTDTATYYDSVKVAVVSAQVASATISGAAAPTAPTATPSTGGGLSATLVGIIVLTAALPLLQRARKEG